MPGLGGAWKLICNVGGQANDKLGFRGTVRCSTGTGSSEVRAAERRKGASARRSDRRCRLIANASGAIAWLAFDPFSSLGPRGCEPGHGLTCISSGADPARSPRAQAAARAARLRDGVGEGPHEARHVLAQDRIDRRQPGGRQLGEGAAAAERVGGWQRRFRQAVGGG